MAYEATAKAGQAPAAWHRRWRRFHSPAAIAVTAAGAAIFMLGAFLPWAERTVTATGVSQTINGIDFDGGRVFWFAVAALAGAWLGLFAVRRSNLLAAGASAAALILGIVRAVDLGWAAQAGAEASGGIGLWIVIIGAIVALAGALWPVPDGANDEISAEADARLVARLGPVLFVLRIAGLAAFVVLAIVALAVSSADVEWVWVLAAVGGLLGLAAWWALGWRNWTGWDGERLLTAIRKHGPAFVTLIGAIALFIFALWLVNAATSKTITANSIVQGVIIGGGYALLAAGLSLIFGVMRLVNLAHGDFVVLIAYGIWYLTSGHMAASGAEMPMLVGFLLMLPIAAVVGFVLQLAIVNRALKSNDLLVPLLVTFGLAIIIQNGLQELFSPDTRSLNLGDVTFQSFTVLGVTMGVLPLLVFAAAILLLGALSFLFYGTKLGRLLRATSDNAITVQLMGVNPRRVYAFAMAISFVVMTFAALALGAQSQFTPTAGPAQLLYAFEAVVIGGLGSLWGTLAGGIILGVSQGIGAELDVTWQQLAGHIVFVVIILVRPRGLFPK